MRAPEPQDEPARLSTLRQLRVLDTPPEPDYDDLTRLAATICGTPIALVSLIDCDRQWFKSRVGLDATETPRDVAFCAHAIRQPDLFVIPDATADDRFRDNPLVTRDPHIRFYAGMPLTTAEGYNLGTLCVIDITPRALAAEQQDALRVLARQVMAQFQLRHQVGELKQTERALRASEEKFRATLDRLAEGVFVVDPAANRIMEANAAILDLLGYTADEFVALEIRDIVARETPDGVGRNIAAIHAALAATGRHDLGRKLLRRKDGGEVPVDVKVTLVPNGGAGLHAVVVRDMTEQLKHEKQLTDYQCELERANARLKTLAHTDGLTGVKNRAAFNDKLADEFDRSVRHAHPLSVVLVDVDHFKPFNDTFGHPAGDAVLKVVAAELQQTLRGTDFVARYGGEEFVLLLPDTDYAGAMVLAERCRRAVAGVPWDKRPITISVGVSTLTAAADAAALVQQADDALYRSKQAGRNRVSHGSHTVPVLATARA